ncbi:MAG: MarR family winged helix-turn-helix transcriptional regulator [Planctomycetota bacterium]
MLDKTVAAIQRDYPKIFMACHVDHVRARGNEHQLSSRESWVLGHLDESDATNPTELAKHLGVVPSTLSAAIQRLEKLGYIERTRNIKNRRIIELRLSKRGSEAMQSSNVLDTKRVEALALLLTEKERDAAEAGLAILARAAAALVSRDGPARAQLSNYPNNHNK